MHFCIDDLLYKLQNPFFRPAAAVWGAGREMCGKRSMVNGKRGGGAADRLHGLTI